MDTDEVCRRVVSCAYNVHEKIGPGLLESVYQPIMVYDLRRSGLAVDSKRRVSFEYEGFVLRDAFVADIIVENKVVVELKSVETLSPAHFKQLLTYLRLFNIRFGLLINFGAALMKDGVKRIVNGW
jgi:GxxExxY protein